MVFAAISLAPELHDGIFLVLFGALSRVLVTGLRPLTERTILCLSIDTVDSRNNFPITSAGA